MKDNKMSVTKKLGIMCTLFVLLQAVGVLLATLNGYFSLKWMAESLILMALCFFIYLSYKNHVKNVMKPLIGATLMAVLFYDMGFAMEEIQYLGYFFEEYGNDLAVIIFVILQIACFVTLAIMNIIHYMINSSHHSNPGKIKANKIIFIIFAAICAAIGITSMLLDGDILYMLSDLLCSLSDAFMVGMVIIIEGTMDEFRINREAAGWTEEKGYPEGYVHEYEKEQK